jgi:hypothetical protein
MTDSFNVNEIFNATGRCLICTRDDPDETWTMMLVLHTGESSKGTPSGRYQQGKYFPDWTNIVLCPDCFAVVNRRAQEAGMVGAR